MRTFKRGGIRFIQIAPITITIARSKAPAARKPRNPVARVREAMAREAAREDRRDGVTLAVGGILAMLAAFGPALAGM